MKEGKLSSTQLMALLWAGLLAPAADQLPGLLLPTAGRGAWLAVLAAGVVLWLLGWAVCRLAGTEGPARALRRGLGPVFGRAVLLIYIMYSVVLLALRLRLCAARLVGGEEQSGAAWPVVLAVALLALWMGRGKVTAFGRTAQIFLVILLVTAGAVLALALPHARLERVFPVTPALALESLRAAPLAAGVLGWGLYASFLLGETELPGEGRRWRWPLWSLGGAVLLAAAQIVVVANLGTGLAMQLDNPFFALAKGVGVEGAFQRVESLVLALWVLADLSMDGVLLLALRVMVKEVFPRYREEKAVVWAVLAAAALALTLFSGRSALRDWNRGIVPQMCLILTFALPGALWIARKKWSKK